MRTLRTVLLLVYALAVCRVASGAAVDRHENDRQQHTSVINLLGTTRGMREEVKNWGVSATTAGNQEEEEYDDDEAYYDYLEEDEASGDYEVGLPRVAMSSKPKDPSSILEADKTERKTRKGKGKKKGKGLGRKRNPCLKKYKNFCIHGTCQYLRDLRAPSCVCLPNYSGERCEFITLPVHSPPGYNRTTALAVVAVVLSSLCLVIIGLLLMLRFHKRGAYDIESEEKVKLGLAPNH
ncbi:Proheparin-binding EGF-like growth factor [Oryzias melastigma]|uniref:Proheparin-binding EGF-like growth factor n=1 Tax=Oryzias melastigma TaxID=30732 RepID=A0A3B3DDF4_ORYME|nr:heparin-binding EGF-like growth factor a [Oryzias melastigma]KAF6731314.1 Proheparin-binding EGF-like growth factor [Oryzias melastigma]